MPTLFPVLVKVSQRNRIHKIRILQNENWGEEGEEKREREIQRKD
jgi:hypothetical protein